jgi:predicted Zn-dependent protease
MLTRTPDLAPLHLLYGQNLGRLGRTKEARTAFSRGLACAAEPDVRTRLLIEQAALADDTRERTRLLREVVALKGNLVAAAQAALILQVLGQSS